MSFSPDAIVKIAHRGAKAGAPENTRLAFDLALDCGMDGIELDVQITRDGVLVINHDPEMTAIDGSNRRIPDLDFAELQDCDWGRWFFHRETDQKVLTLDAVLTAYGGRTRLYIEMKPAPSPADRTLYAAMPQKVTAAVNRLVPTHRRSAIHLLSFDAAMLRAAHDLAPDLRAVYNLEPPFSEDAALAPENPFLFGYCLAYQDLTASFAAAAHRGGRQVLTYACNDHKSISLALAAGVDGIMTDDPCGNCWRRFMDQGRQPGAFGVTTSP